MKEISQETIEKISQTKLENSRSKIIEGFVKSNIPNQSLTQLAIPSHRTRQWITFEQFKQEIAQGKSLQQLCKEYSKHLMNFYSALSQGKITLSKEKFEEDYNKGIPLDEIARSNNMSREHITYLREYYGIKRKGAKYQKRLQNEVPLSQEAKDIIIGSLLGDGHVTPLGYFSEKHSEKQVEYLEWKAEFLKPILTPKSFSVYKQLDKRYNSTNYSFCLRTTAHSFLYEMREKFYKEIDGEWIKIIPDDIEEMMNEMVLAVWFMDDGSTDWMYRSGSKEYMNTAQQCKISSQSFSLEDNIKLSNSIMSKFGLSSNIRFRRNGNEHPFIKFDSESSVKLTSLLKPISVKCCLYKFSEEAYLSEKDTIIDPEAAMQIFIKKHNIS